MTVLEFKNVFNKNLESQIDKNELNELFFWLIDHYCKIDKIRYIVNENYQLNNQEENDLRKAIKLLKKETPVQYIIGTAEFKGMNFNVNSNVLIPRPETEELVTFILDKVSKLDSHYAIKKDNTIKILDIGTGSGCISIALKKSLPLAEISALEKSDKALRIAEKNTHLNKVDINLIQQDILKTTELNNTYDIIVSNPPYVRESEKKEIKNNVLNNEPHMALFVEDNNPLIFFDKIAELAKNHLTKNGLLFFEINQYLGKETVDLIRLKGFNTIELKKDIFGHDRVIIASIL